MECPNHPGREMREITVTSVCSACGQPTKRSIVGYECGHDRERWALTESGGLEKYVEPGLMAVETEPAPEPMTESEPEPEPAPEPDVMPPDDDTDDEPISPSKRRKK